VILNVKPDFESLPAYDFDIVLADGDDTVEYNVLLPINNLDELRQRLLR